MCECCCCCYFFFTRTFFSYIYSIRLLAFTPFLCAMFFFLSDFSVCALTQGIEMCAVGFFFLETYRHRIIRNIMFTWSVHSVCICWSAHRFYEKRRKNAHNSQNKKKKKKKSMWSAYVEMHILYLYFFPSFFFPILCLTRTHSIRFRQQKKKDFPPISFIHRPTYTTLTCNQRTQTFQYSSTGERNHFCPNNVLETEGIQRAKEK